MAGKQMMGRLVSLGLGLTLSLLPAQAKPSKAHPKAKHERRATPQRKRPRKASSRLPQPTPHRLVLNSLSVLVQDQQTGKELVEKAPDTVLPIASITKLMTVMVVLDARQNPEEELLIDHQDLDLLRHSRSRLPLGTRLPRKEALKLALMASENRAANALGHAYPGGMSACVAAMNAKAKALGLGHTRFVDPAGLGDENVSSARDLVQLVRTAYTYYPEIRRDSTTAETELQSGSRSLHFINTSRLVRGGQWVIGLSKTGFIDEAGHCLVMQAQLASRKVFIVLLKAPGKLTHFGDANRIRQWLERRP
ncbi:MAG: D-alanyl-D-alanine endopeptidase [Holophagaceae bacterium]|nr:D-alanyl-D-alanine endopeptidase [Holophagaceae bacterium]